MILPYAITGIVSAYPEKVIMTDDLSFESEMERSVFKRKMGVHQRRSSNGKLTAKDLGTTALKNLLEGLKWASNDIDVLISITQTPDYTVPGNSYLYQKEIGFSKNCQLVDLNYGCTGFIQGLLAAYSYGEFLNASKILMVVGDTDILTSESQPESYKLMGDTVCAIALERSEATDVIFKIAQDGEYYEAICSLNSASRSISNQEETRPQVHMNGASIQSYIANFVLKYLVEFESSFTLPNDWIFMHQPNLLFHQYIIKKMRWDKEKCPTVIEDFGNVSSAMIPLTIQKHQHLLQENNIVSLISFGVGLSFAAVQMSLSPLVYSSEIECK